MNSIRNAAFNVQDKPMSFNVIEHEKLTQSFQIACCNEPKLLPNRGAVWTNGHSYLARLYLCKYMPSKTGFLYLSSKIYIAAVSKSRYENPADSHQAWQWICKMYEQCHSSLNFILESISCTCGCPLASRWLGLCALTARGSGRRTDIPRLCCMAKKTHFIKCATTYWFILNE